jgi:exopolyphosphatase/guanosine-5'-triphosphate,3'-diphosphate pyrophosphatase
MKVAVIDMGTNTFHLLIVELVKDDFKVLYREKTAVRLGKGGIEKGLITKNAWKRALSTLTIFKEVAEKYDVSKIYATATSAIRNAKNGRDLVADIEDKTGITTRIINGREEAEYIYFGVQKAMNLGKETNLIMDIGGGSIEFIIANAYKIFWLQSFEIGGQRMIDRFHRHDPITVEEISNLEHYLFEELKPLFDAMSIHQPTTLVGSSGTFDTLSEIYCKRDGRAIDPDASEFPLTIKAFEEIFQDIISKTRAERLAIDGMIPLRVDMIVVASVLVKYILDSFGIKHIRVSAFALKEGVLLKTIEEHHATKALTSNNQ